MVGQKISNQGLKLWKDETITLYSNRAYELIMTIE